MPYMKFGFFQLNLFIGLSIGRLVAPYIAFRL